MLIMKKFIYTFILFSTPLLVFAQSPRDLNDVMLLVVVILDTLIPILIGLAVLMFIWGIFRYYASDNANTKKEAVKIIGYGVVSIFVMVSLWGLVNFIAYSLRININGSGSSNTLPPKSIDVEAYSNTIRR